MKHTMSEEDGKSWYSGSIHVRYRGLLVNEIKRKTNDWNMDHNCITILTVSYTSSKSTLDLPNWGTTLVLTHQNIPVFYYSSDTCRLSYFYQNIPVLENWK